MKLGNLLLLRLWLIIFVSALFPSMSFLLSVIGSALSFSRLVVQSLMQQAAFSRIKWYCVQYLLSTKEPIDTK